MNYKKIFKRETKVIVYVVICLTLAIIGSSYALFLKVKTNTNNQVVTAGSLVITYSNGNVISNNDAESCLKPQDATEASSGGCKFMLSITNNGTLPVEYNLLVYYNDGVTNPLDYSLIRHSLTKSYTVADKTETVNTDKKISELSNYSDTTKKVLETTSIDVGETIEFTLNIWIDEDATIDIIGKQVNLKLDVISNVYEDEDL